MNAGGVCVGGGGGGVRSCWETQVGVTDGYIFLKKQFIRNNWKPQWTVETWHVGKFPRITAGAMWLHNAALIRKTEREREPMSLNHNYCPHLN